MVQDYGRRNLCLRKKIKRGNFIPCQVIKNQLDINEYIKLNAIVMVQ
jgi:hypothetical protein